jgi:hypothetical protein
MVGSAFSLRQQANALMECRGGELVSPVQISNEKRCSRKRPIDDDKPTNEMVRRLIPQA